MTSRSVVMAGGGVAGIAWLLGVVSALRDGGVDLTEADRLVGTSAGAAVAAQLATDVIEFAAAAQLRPETAERLVSFDAETYLAAAAAALTGAASRRDAARRMASLPLQQTDIDAAGRRAIVAARLPQQEWPARDLAICTVAQGTGDRVVFRREDGVPLVDAVTASCAVPGVWPAVSIGERSYVDGGAYSLTNADVAKDADLTVVLVPTVANDQQRNALTGELHELEPGHSFVLAADDDAVAAFGPNPLDPSRRAPAFEAGRRQGALVTSKVAESWNS